MSKHNLKKFRISLELEADDLLVWGENSEAVENVLSDLWKPDLLEYFNSNIEVTAYEVTDLSASEIRDGVITENEGWRALCDYRDDEGNPIELTDEDSEATQAELESAGQLRIPF